MLRWADEWDLAQNKILSLDETYKIKAISLNSTLQCIKLYKKGGGCAEPAKNRNKIFTAPGDLSPNLYSGTFKRFATKFSSI
jgi:hypothetical protein